MLQEVKSRILQFFNIKRKKIDAKYALEDVMDHVCEYVDPRDLKSIALVCKSWKGAALREQAKRCCIQHLCLPYGKAIRDNALLDVNKPYITMLIFTSILKKPFSHAPPNNEINAIEIDDYCVRCAYDKLEDEYMGVFKKQLPNKKVLLQVDEYFTTNGVEGQNTVVGQSTVVGRSEDILGLFISNLPRRIHVHLASIKVGDPENTFSNISTRLTEELGLNNCEYHKSTILLFGSFYEYFALPNSTICNSILDFWKRAKQNNKEIALATFFGSRLGRKHNCHRNFWADDNDLELFMLLRITGPTLESWSTFINHRSPLDEIERSLQDLKERVKRKRFCTGLYFSPKCFTIGSSRRISYPSGNSWEMMGTLNRIFPGIPFMGSFVNLHDDPTQLVPNVQSFSDCDEIGPKISK